MSFYNIIVIKIFVSIGYIICFLEIVLYTEIKSHRTLEELFLK